MLGEEPQTAYENNGKLVEELSGPAQWKGGNYTPL